MLGALPSSGFLLVVVLSSGPLFGGCRDPLQRVIIPGRTVELLIEISQSFSPMPVAAISSGRRRLRVAVRYAYRLRDELQSIFDCPRFGMADRDVTVAGVGCRFRGAGPRQAAVGQQVSALALNRVDSVNLLPLSLAYPAQEYRSRCIAAVPGPVKTAVHGCSCPREIWVHVVSKREHWADSGACRSERRIGEPGPARGIGESLHVSYGI